MKSQRKYSALNVLVFAGCMTLFVQPWPATAQPALLEGLDEQIESAMAEHQVPGLALAVVKDGSVVYSQGYGVREVGKPGQVDEATLFSIASLTKAFTATAAGILVQEGRLSWDDPVVEYLPEFRLHDPWVTQQITVRDLLAHRSGLSGVGLLAIWSDFSSTEQLRRLRYLKPSWSFRSRFSYCNLCYLAAGEIIARVSGRSWETFVTERLLRPLGMKRSGTRIHTLAEKTNVAVPHSIVEGTTTPAPHLDTQNVAPAGAMHASAREMAEWMKLQLAMGRHEGRELVDSTVMQEIRTPQMLAPSPIDLRELAENHFVAYGMGWGLHDTWGRLLVSHGGGLPGIATWLSLVPEEKLGVVVLTNTHDRSVPFAVILEVVTRYLGVAEEVDLFARYGHQIEKDQQAEDHKRLRELQKKRIENTSPSLPLEGYTGTYGSDLYGEAEVSLEEDRLVFRYSSKFVLDLKHWHQDVFRAKRRMQVWEDFGDPIFVHFELDAVGKIKKLTLREPLDPRDPEEVPVFQTTGVGE